MHIEQGPKCKMAPSDKHWKAKGLCVAEVPWFQAAKDCGLLQIYPRRACRHFDQHRQWFALVVEHRK